MSIKYIILEPSEVSAIEYLIEGALNQLNASNIEEHLHYLSVLSCDLPQRLRKFVKDFCNTIDDATRLCLIENFKFNTDIPTPLHLDSNTLSLSEDITVCLVASLLGEVFGWKEEQGGRVIHNVAPLKHHESSQESTGSLQTIHWHTEEAFHNFSSDYLAIACIKNPDQVATTYCSINSLDLSDPIFDVLFEPRFIFKKVDSHKGCGNEKFTKSILYGSRSKPFIRIDHYFMDTIDSLAQVALNTLIEYIDNSLAKVILKPGDILLIDNALCVHGRDNFKANYDGNDRWLKRINITRDLYKSRNRDDNACSKLLS